MDLGRDRIVSKIISRLAAKTDEGAVKVSGTWGSYAPMLAAYISGKLRRPILYVRPHIDDAEKCADDLMTFGAESVETLPAWEGQEDLADATDEIRAERLRITMKFLSQKASQFIICASVQAICQPVPKPESLESGNLRLTIDKTIAPQDVTAWLIDNGFEHVERVDLPGQFASRGGIVDVYAPLAEWKNDNTQTKKTESAQGSTAVRLEFFGDTIESIRQINLDTQRSSDELESIGIISAVCGTKAEQKELFINILPPQTLIIFEEPADVEEVAKVFVERLRGESVLYGWTDIYKAIPPRF